MAMSGVAIYVSDAAKENIGVYFEDSRHRSRRTYKKLIKRFGGQIIWRPCILNVAGKIYAHPAVEKELRESMRNE